MACITSKWDSLVLAAQWSTWAVPCLTTASSGWTVIDGNDLAAHPEIHVATQLPLIIYTYRMLFHITLRCMLMQFSCSDYMCGKIICINTGLQTR